MMTPAFLISPPGCGAERIAQAMARHREVDCISNAQVLTPLAYLGYYDNVHKAAYDHILAAESQRLFVERLPGKEQDYIEACRQYCLHLYQRRLEQTGKTIILDATPDYVFILPFIETIFPDAGYVVVTRHPLAAVDELLRKTGANRESIASNVAALVQATTKLGRFLMRRSQCVRAQCEEFDATPLPVLERICAHLNIAAPAANDQTMAEAATDEASHAESGHKQTESVRAARGGGEPVNTSTWARRLAGDALLVREIQRQFNRMDSRELAAFGYTWDTLWKPLEDATGRSLRPGPVGAAVKSLRRSLRTVSRRTVNRIGPLKKLVKMARLGCDVLLRE